MITIMVEKRRGQSFKTAMFSGAHVIINDESHGGLECR